MSSRLSVMQTCVPSLLGSVILHQAPKGKRTQGGWCFADAPDRHPLISSPRVCSLQMPLGTKEVIAREPEIKTGMLDRVLCPVWALSNAGGEEVWVFQVLYKGGLLQLTCALGLLKSFAGRKRSVLVAKAPREHSEQSSNFGKGLGVWGEDLLFQNICVRQQQKLSWEQMDLAELSRNSLSWEGKLASSHEICKDRCVQ